ncbi:hypothetical protein P154DRAFT_324027 [Amniculicola lignicola CBS 123094]|uniref:Uncharacterized protein n=1 Tax=Amniculicola lignicola CBS 123094 TaxID=1392246 RepID=A0A6A5W2Y4_9PLEO|nr:hypothetical protein P154DRAFT_324027 [Amniculicola lignicola CBS 123094]
MCVEPTDPSKSPKTILFPLHFLSILPLLFAPDSPPHHSPSLSPSLSKPAQTFSATTFHIIFTFSFFFSFSILFLHMPFQLTTHCLPQIGHHASLAHCTNTSSLSPLSSHFISAREAVLSGDDTTYGVCVMGQKEVQRARQSKREIRPIFCGGSLKMG